MTEQTKGRVEEIAQFSGGTDPNPAYADVKDQGKIDSHITFTDGYFFSETWPESSARHHIIGLFSSPDQCTPPPATAVVIPCKFDD